MGLTKTTQAFVQKMIDASLGYINIQSLGCSPSMKNDSGKILSEYIMNQPEFSTVKLYAPQGQFWIGSTLYWADRKVILGGYGIGDTFFYSEPGVDGIFIDSKKNQVYDNVLKNFSLLPYGKPTTICHGIKIWQRSIVENVQVQGYSGRGIWIDGYAVGDGKHDDKHNATFTKIMHNYIAGNGWEGILIDGQDASQTIVFCNDIRNNGSWGIRDSTFLGCPHIGNLFHDNKEGALVVDHPNATGVLFAGNYLENNSSRVVAWKSTEISGNTGTVNVEYWEDKTPDEVQTILRVNR